MGPCCVSTSSQSYPLCAGCSATVGLCALRNRPILGCPARSCFLNSDPLSAGSGMLSSLKMELRSVPYGARRRPEIFLLVTGGQGWVDCRMQIAECRIQNSKQNSKQNSELRTHNAEYGMRILRIRASLLGKRHGMTILARGPIMRTGD